MTVKSQYSRPEAELVCMHPFLVLAQSFNGDNYSEYFDEEYGGQL